MLTRRSSPLQMSSIAPQHFPSFGSALMISMGYVDLGKWLAAIEGGACFGFNLLLIVIFMNFCALFCQYLSTSIGVATGRNLAQIYSKEYSRSVCILLGFQAEVSAIVLDISSVLGISYGVNILSGLDNFTCILYSAVGSIILSSFLTYSENDKVEMLYVGISSFALLFYVLGVLISQPEVPFTIDGFLPRLNGETVYSLMALLGANVMVHNFYTHSSVIQQQRRLPNVSVGSLSHDHFFAILFVFSGIFLVNYVLMNSAASVFDNTGVGASTFQDIFLLLDQVFKTPIPPIAFLLVLLFSGLVKSLSWNIGGLDVLRDLFQLDFSALVHQMVLRILAAMVALYCAKTGDAEGIYQLLISCQVVSAMLLPSSIIPLLRVASSGSLMGGFKIAWYLEVLALLAFVGIFAANIIFISELAFGNSSWIVSLRGIGGGSLSLHFLVTFSISLTSMMLTLYLAVTPLRSASYGADAQTCKLHLQMNQQELDDDGGKVDLGKNGYEDLSTIEPAESSLQNPSDSHSEHSISALRFDGPDIAAVLSDGSQLPAHDMDSAFVPVSESNLQNSKYDPQNLPVDITDKLPSTSILERDDMHGAVSSSCIDCNLQPTINRNIEEQKGVVYEHESSTSVIPPSQSHSTGSSRNSKVKTEELSGSIGSISKLSGLGRATRRQFAAVLDEFWGLIFDFHGKVTQEAITKRFNVLLGLDPKHLPETQRSGTMANTRDYGSSGPKNGSPESMFPAQMGSTSWSSNIEPLNPLAQSSWLRLSETSGKRYSSLRLPQNSDNWGYQPATIHGCQYPSSLRGFSANRYAEPTSIPFDSLSSKCSEAFSQRLEHGSLTSLPSSDLRSLVLSRTNIPAERPYSGTSFFGTDISTSVYNKKYHSLPDISGLAVSSRHTISNDQNIQWEDHVSSRVPIGRISHQYPQYSKHISGTGGSLTFDELSVSGTYGNILTMPSTTMPDTKSLWSKEPFQLFGMENKAPNHEVQSSNRISSSLEQTFSYAESETKILQSLRLCILKLLKLEGSDWLFRQDGGADEELVDLLAAKEWFLSELDTNEVNLSHCNGSFHSCTSQKLTSSMSYEEVDVSNLYPLPNCGESCIWRMSLIVNFGVWCILRVLELSLVESRPELWGKYTYVLNRLQGILEPAFAQRRFPSVPCPCVSIPAAHRRPPSPRTHNGLQLSVGKTLRGTCTSAITVLEMIKDVETAISSRKGRTGTAAGDIAFPKGKENLASVLKRYKRRLSNKSPGNCEAGSFSRKVPLPPSL